MKRKTRKPSDPYPNSGTPFEYRERTGANAALRKWLRKPGADSSDYWKKYLKASALHSADLNREHGYELVNGEWVKAGKPSKQNARKQTKSTAKA